VQAHFGKPRVSYRETLLAPVEAEGSFERAVAGQTLHAVVRLSLEPEPGTPGVRVSPSEGVQGLGEELLQGLLAAVKGTAEGGGAFGFPMTGVHAIVLQAQVLEGNDAAAALFPAATLALYNALGHAKVAVMEPLMSLELRTPEEYLGPVLKQLSALRAVISETRVERAHTVVTGAAPLAVMFGFTTILRSLTQGRASFSMEPLDYQPVADAEGRFHRRLHG